MNAFLFILLTCIWGGSYVAIKIAVTDLPVIFSAAVRMVLALLFLSLIPKPKWVAGKNWPGVTTAGIFLIIVPCFSVFWGERFISPGMGGILNGTVPLWTFAMGVLFLPRSEPLTLKRVLGMAFGALGTLVVFWPILRFGGSAEEFWGSLSVLGMAISYAVGTLLNRRLLHRGGIDLFANLYQQQLFSTVVCVVISLGFAHDEWISVDWKSSLHPILALLYLGTCSTAVAWLIYFRLIRDWGAVRASSVGYLIPVASVVMDKIWFGRSPNPYEFVGTLLILTGVLLIQLPKRKAAKSRHRHHPRPQVLPG